MLKFILGVIVGIFVSTVGFSTIAKFLDDGVNTIKVESKKLSEQK